MATVVSVGYRRNTRTGRLRSNGERVTWKSRRGAWFVYYLDDDGRFKSKRISRLEASVWRRRKGRDVEVN